MATIKINFKNLNTRTHTHTHTHHHHHHHQQQQQQQQRPDFAVPPKSIVTCTTRNTTSNHSPDLAATTMPTVSTHASMKDQDQGKPRMR